MNPVDDLGEIVPLSAPPTRVVSLVPSLTEAIAESAPGVLIGATDYCVRPSTLDVARVGGSKYPKLDRVFALRPDLVVANVEENRRDDVDALRANGIAVWVTEAPATVPAALASIRRLLATAFELAEPAWLRTAEQLWREVPPVRHTAIVPVWRRPWVVVGRDTFIGDVLRRLGVANAYAGHAERYPRPPLAELNRLLDGSSADLVVLPDEPYEFTADDGPEAFPGARWVLVPGRHLSWYSPALIEAHRALSQALQRL